MSGISSITTLRWIRKVLEPELAVINPKALITSYYIFPATLPLLSIDLVKGESVCRRKIIGYADEKFLTFYKDEAAICEFRVTSRLNCIPDEFFNKFKKFRRQQLLESFKHEKCSSPNLLEYKKQTRSRWQKHKEKLRETKAD